MKNKIILVMMCFISLSFFASTLYGQDSKKTITLANGEAVWDLNGEWNVWVEPALMKPWPQIWKITQKGSSFTAIRMIDDEWQPKGTCVLEGVLDKRGIKKATIATIGWGEIEAEGQIQNNGNKIVIDAAEKIRFTATRK